MCSLLGSLSELMKKIDMEQKNALMKEHFALEPSVESSLFYQQNTFNKPLSLSFYRKKNEPNFRKCDNYPCRSGRCFPASAPLACTPMVHRTKGPDRPRSPNDVLIPSHQTLHKKFTIKIDKRFLRKD